MCPSCLSLLARVGPAHGTMGEMTEQEIKAENRPSQAENERADGTLESKSSSRSPAISFSLEDWESYQSVFDGQ